MQEIQISYMQKIQNEVKNLNIKNELETLQELFGGELLLNNTLLKINRFCSIEYFDDKYKLTTMIYGCKKEMFGTKKEIMNILKHNI